ncbi:MAG: DUF6687 family protein [Polyangiales bacterium]
MIPAARAVVDAYFLRDAGVEPPQVARILYADGSAGPEFRRGIDLELSHWVPNTTPARWKADTSTEICLRFAADPPGERYDLAVNNHVDVDGILSLFSLVHSSLALAHRDVVLGAAEMGDFSAGVDRPAFRLAHELTMLLDESRKAGWDARTSYERAFALTQSVLSGDRAEHADVERAWAILERGQARIASGEVQIERVGEHFVSYRLPLLEGDDLARALRVPSFNPLIDDSIWLWPHARRRRYGQHAELVSVRATEGWFHDLWLPGYVWADTPNRWSVPGLLATGSSNEWRIERPTLRLAFSKLRDAEHGTGTWTIADRLTPFATLNGRGFPVVASFVDDAGAPAVSSLDPSTVAAVLSPAFEVAGVREVEHMAGKGSRAPLDPTRRYVFHRTIALGDGDKWELGIPYRQRGSWDDYGVVEHEEQDALVEALITSLGIARTAAYPGTWYFADAAAVERLWSALRDCIIP